MSDWHLDITGALAGISLLGVWGCGGRILGMGVQEQSTGGCACPSVIAASWWGWQRRLCVQTGDKEASGSAALG